MLSSEKRKKWHREETKVHLRAAKIKIKTCHETWTSTLEHIWKGFFVKGAAGAPTAVSACR